MEKLSREEMVEMALSEDWEIREKIAQNENCPVNVLIKLSEDDNWEVRQAVVMNKNCPIKVLFELSDDDEWTVRHVVASNENCPIEVLFKLSDDEDFDVREAANFRIKPMQDIYKFNIIKHISKHEKKDGLRDLYKAKDYLEMLIKLEEGEEK